MHIFLYVCAILCTVVGLLFAFPLILVAPFLAGLGAIVKNTRPAKADKVVRTEPEPEPQQQKTDVTGLTFHQRRMLERYGNAYR